MNPIPKELISEHLIDDSWNFAISVTPQWRDLDPFGHVNHRTHLTWCEEARNAYLDFVGFQPLALDTPGPVLKSVSFAYERPISYRSEVIVTAAIVSMRERSFRMKYALWHRGCLGSGEALIVLIKNSTGEKVAIENQIRSRIIELDHPEV